MELIRFSSEIEHIKFAFMNETTVEGHITIKFVGTTENIADMFTKALTQVKVENSCELNSFRSIYWGKY